MAVRDDDFRTSLELDGLTYTAGRNEGVRRRGDSRVIVHAVQGDLQGDELEGEARLPAPAWVIGTHRAGDKAAFLYVDEAGGTIVRELMRDGRRVGFRR